MTRRATGQDAHRPLRLVRDSAPTVDSEPRRLYSIDGTCHQLSIKRSTLYELIARGEIRTVRIGSRQFVTADELDRYVAELQRRAAS